MIAVTEAAKDLVQAIEHPQTQVVRLDVVGPEKYGLQLGAPEPHDQVVEHDGRDVLHIAEAISVAADGATLDRLDTPQGPTLVFTPPPDKEPAAV
jgi:hypothetical protein